MVCRTALAFQTIALALKLIRQATQCAINKFHGLNHMRFVATFVEVNSLNSYLTFICIILQLINNTRIPDAVVKSQTCDDV